MRAEAEVDVWLVDRARDGDLDAFDVLVRRHRDRIHRIALRMLGNSADAEDITQDVVIQLWSGLAGYAGSSAFTTWLYRVVVNRCLNQRRRRALAEDIPAEHEPHHPATVGSDRRVVDRMRLAATMDALARLPHDQRSVLVLHEVEGLSYAEVARVLRITVPAVRNRLARARARLAHELREWT